jgi:hypothetical protein
MLPRVIGSIGSLKRGFFISDTVEQRMPNKETRMPKKPKKPRKEPAERVLIIDEWDKWVKGKIPKGEKGTDMQGLEFHGYLGREKPLLLEFKYAGNRWQQVKVWLREAERILR